ncbi:MAG: FAD-dependent oxidoreductase [Oscillatoriaceae bacterium SKW80]|nr:FAD-dependent oxidoreductase [Oscillatoriaceae bacterium SKYG93]MCX8119967.1 FAD-dependent oxidoreductase [Oscillatoriaceae bacterium SKW80]MDW8454128.1 FAD-dependent oxidoreductase [Oscillatoriaceae cyanobacterium SKYGB_i_bin93]
MEARSENKFDIAVIGAGMAGLTCAQQLQQAGYSVVVVEKSRGVGGRVATRRVGNTRVDHGARYLEPKSELLRRLVLVLRSRGIVDIWTDTTYAVNPITGKLSVAEAGGWCLYYVAPEGMNAVGKFLASDLNIWLNRRVQRLAAKDGKIWYLTLEAANEDAQTPTELTARAVVVAIPAPQALILLAPLTDLPAEFLRKVRYAEYQPCISVLAAYPAFRQQDMAQRDVGWRAVIFPKESQLAWIGWDSSKRALSAQPVFVLHSSPEFAQQYLDAEDLQPAAQALIAEAAKFLLPWGNSPEWMQVHRWRYAFPSYPLSETCLSAATPLPLVCCGDWCGGDVGGNFIESALNSGIAAAKTVNQFLENLDLPGEGFWDAIARK